MRIALFNSLVFAGLLALIVSASAEVGVQGQSSTTALAFAAAASTTDLINAGQPTLASATVTPSSSSFSGSGINDGVCANDPLVANTFFQFDVDFPASATYQLNLTGAPNGYDITSITSLMGWSTVSQRQANQDYIVEVSVVGSAGYKPIARVNYAPFSDNGGNYETQVTLTENTSGVLAAHVDGIRFLFGDPGNGGSIPGTVVREIDVQGTPSAAAPPAVTVQTVTDYSESDQAYAAEVSNNDLVNSGQSTLSGFTTSTTPWFGAGGQNDGTYGLADIAAASWYQPAQMPAVLTFEMNTAASPAGYVVSAIRTFAGWKGGGTQTYANQKYAVEYRSVGSAIWTALESVDYSPFSTLSDAPANTRVVLSNPSGDLLTGVAALRFTFQTPTRAGGANNGTILQEIDAIGYPVGAMPGPVVSVSNLAQRQIIQRGAANAASIPITGTYTGAPDRIEARAVVMAGASNSGTSTAWTTIVAAPSSGAFSAILANVAAGGWYQIEVRGVTSASPDVTTVREKIGVGDIYITCGQSNSANSGSPAATVTDDRVSAWDHTNGVWTKATDPMPGASGGGGSVWSRLGDVLAARDNIPVAFACLGVGSTTVSQWTPTNNEHYPKVRTAVQAFPVNGFRAVLWHQGESDSISSTTPADYQARMESIIAQSRADAGWTVPWGLAEAAFHPDTHLGQEEQVVAGQRRTIFADAQVFPGPVTDDFHLEGKTSDGVHFNATGLADHATQWAEVLGGTPPLAPKNSNFESNTALADGGVAEINTTSSASPSVIGWRALAASGQAAADGSCGYYNPTEAWYAGATDSGDTSGIAPRMLGRHVAFLSGSAANAHFLQTRRAMLASQTSYTLTVALGLRNTADPFGGATLELLADGAVIASRAISRADLDAANGGNATGKFTDMTLTASTGSTVVSGKPLAVRIVKSGGAGTYLDFDNVRLTSALNLYSSWQSANSTTQAADLDHDNDGVSNGVEHFLGGTGNTTGNSNPLPGVIDNAGTLSITWIRHPDFPGFPDNYGTAFVVETSATLAAPWTPAVIGTGEGKVEITGNNVKYTLPSGSKNFARLKVVAPSP